MSDANSPQDENEAARSQQRGGEASNTPRAISDAPHVVVCGVDTLELGLKGEVPMSLLDRIETLKAEAQRHREGDNKAFPEISMGLNGVVFLVQPHGRGSYRYVLKNDDLELRLARRVSNFPNVYLKFLSHYLWTVGYEWAVTDFKAWWVEVIGEVPIEESVGRLDLCVDLLGWRPRVEDLDRFVTRAVKDAQYRSHQQLTGFTFGESGLRARLYNKTVEIRESGKQWLESVWQQRLGFIPSEVWRLEFQHRREALKEFGITTWEQTVSGLNGLWAYDTCSWLSFRMPTDPNVTRRSTDPAWQVVQNLHFNEVACPVIRERRRELSVERSGAALLGSLSSMAAVLGITDFDYALNYAQHFINKKLEKSGQTFKEAVRRKQARRGSSVLKKSGNANGYVE